MRRGGQGTMPGADIRMPPSFDLESLSSALPARVIHTKRGKTRLCHEALGRSTRRASKASLAAWDELATVLAARVLTRVEEESYRRTIRSDLSCSVTLSEQAIFLIEVISLSTRTHIHARLCVREHLKCNLNSYHQHHGHRHGFRWPFRPRLTFL